MRGLADEHMHQGESPGRGPREQKAQDWSDDPLGVSRTEYRSRKYKDDYQPEDGRQPLPPVLIGGCTMRNTDIAFHDIFYLHRSPVPFRRPSANFPLAEPGIFGWPRYAAR